MSANSRTRGFCVLPTATLAKSTSAAFISRACDIELAVDPLPMLAGITVGAWAAAPNGQSVTATIHNLKIRFICIPPASDTDIEAIDSPTYRCPKKCGPVSHCGSPLGFAQQKPGGHRPPLQGVNKMGAETEIEP